MAVSSIPDDLCATPCGTVAIFWNLDGITDGREFPRGYNAFGTEGRSLRAGDSAAPVHRVNSPKRTAFP